MRTLKEMMKLSTPQTQQMLLRAGMVAALVVGTIAVAESAQAQVYFRPFAYTYSSQQPTVEEPAPYGSYGSVARILAREGYRLVGPLGSRGDQVVATGVDSAGRRMRFFIDPYEGEVLQSRPIASAHAYEAPSEAGYSPSPDGVPSSPQSEPRVIPGLSEETLPGAEPRHDAEQRRNRSPHAKLTPQSQTAARPAAAEPPLPHAAAKLDPGSRRALAPPRPAAGMKSAAPSAPPTANAKAPSESPIAPAPASLAQPAVVAAPTAAPAAPAPAASQPATDGTQNAAVAQPAASEPTAPPVPASASSSPAAAPAASATAAPAKPEAAAPNSKGQNGVGG
jgi:hypothetical protein